ncbi:uncharacterized protein LOC131998021 [Stomoxys calcitrans]|uniref:uncharacterized protein LOC131998021 n=1 Tax=Stomoxys calcitrans TaxID=35570 RepID=UPI0027E34F6A|nr:uncharacterized protein LOC131998021 [Stomoxys calcitrans]
MQCRCSSNLAVLLTLLALTAAIPKTRRVLLRPLSAKEVYKVLKAAGREDAIPEGRVVTQGLSAITGFALGVGSGIGAALLVDLATSNITTEYFTSLFGGSSSSNTAATGNSLISEEICFLSRNMDYNDRQGRQTSPTTTGTATGTGTTGTQTPITTSPTTPTSPTTGTATTTAGDDDTTCITIEKNRTRARKRRSAQRKFYRRHFKTETNDRHDLVVKNV